MSIKQCQPGDKFTINSTTYTIDKNLTFTDKQVYCDQKILDGLYEMLRITSGLFKKYNIETFAIAGTLLSVERHGYLMPWDDDIDLGYKIEYHEKFKLLRNDLLDANYSLYECAPGYVIQNMNNRFVAMDLFAIAKKNNQYMYAAPIVNNVPMFRAALVFPKEIFLPKEIDSLNKSTICGIEILIPSNSQKILVRHYGENVYDTVRGVPSTKSHVFRNFQFLAPFLEKHVNHRIMNSVANLLLM